MSDVVWFSVPATVEQPKIGDVFSVPTEGGAAWFELGSIVAGEAHDETVFYRLHPAPGVTLVKSPEVP